MDNTESILKKEITSLEQEQVPDLELLDKKNKEVKIIRSEKIKGSIIRAKWLGEGDKTSKFLYIRKPLIHRENY